MISIEQTQDFQIITELNAVVQSWHHENYPEHFKPFDFDTISKAIKSMLEQTNVTALIAIKDGVPCGYVLCIENLRPENPFQYEHRFLQVDHVAVLPEFQGKGIASALLEAVEDFAMNSGIQELHLDHWEKNEVAAKFFANSGFTNYNFRMKKNLT